jgi:hypothetical protein
MFGNQSKKQIGEKNDPTVYSRLWYASSAVRNNTYGPTPQHYENLDIAEKEFENVRDSLNNIIEQRIPEIEQSLMDAGAPWIEGQPIPGG